MISRLTVTNDITHSTISVICLGYLPPTLMNLLYLLKCIALIYSGRL